MSCWNLLNIMRLGFSALVISFLLMIWVSFIEGKSDPVRYPPCYFNPLCSCSKAVPDLGIMTCRDVHLPRIPDTVNTSKVFMLQLENNGLRTITPFFLQATGLYKIVISHNPLVFLPDEALLGLERSLWELELSHDQLSEVPNRALRYLQKLRLLDLTGNFINKISPENWRGLENSLEVLILAENSITHLPIDSFSGLTMLDTIDLKGNNLKELEPAVFRDGMGRLSHLILSDNQLGAIPYQALQPLRVLKTLDLSFNRINKMTPVEEPGVMINFNFQLNLDVFRLDYNQLTILEPVSFQYFNVVNKTYLDGNPLSAIEDNAFQKAKIRELYLRGCGLTQLSPASFTGLENYLELLDLSGNNISQLPTNIFHRLSILRTLSLRDNIIARLNPAEIFNNFQFVLYKLDLSGQQNFAVSIQELRRLRSLRFLSLSKLLQKNLAPEDFLEFGIDLEELQIHRGGLQTIKNNAFKFVHGLKKLDFSDNSIGTIENHAFVDIGHSLVSLKLARGLSSSFQTIPVESFQVLNNLEDLDLSNNRLKNMPETSFHFLRNLQSLKLHDNLIELVHKGTFQGDIHGRLEEIFLSFNFIRIIQQHTFVQLSKLEQLHLDDNKIDTIERRGFMNLEHLKRLNLKGNKISKISYEAFQNLPELEDLDLSYNKLTNFDFSMFDQVGTLAMLHVNASFNNLKELSVNIPQNYDQIGSGGVHANIRVLDLSHNNISSISKQFFRPIELSITHLHLHHNKMLNASREVFGNMPHLQWLDLSDNGMYEMNFDLFRNTKKLQVLMAKNNKIAELPIDIFRFLTNLRIVDLSGNRLRNLPDNLFREEGLEKLDLSHNLLSKLPLTSMSISTAQTLCELDLSWNSISSLSQSGILGRFKSLNFLDLSYNRLVQIDAGTFKGLPKLAVLDLSHNVQLSLESNGLAFQGLEYNLLSLNLDNVSLTIVPTLPTTQLVRLSLAHNSLPTIPMNLAANLSKLQELNLNYNDLTAIPIVTHSLTELRSLSMVDNPITFLSNTSLLGMIDRLMDLDIRNFDLTVLESGAFCKLQSLRTLKLSLYKDLRTFNVHHLLQFNAGLQNLEIHVNTNTDKNLDKEMAGDWPPKLRNITFSGLGLKRLGMNVLHGVRSPNLNFCLYNTSVQTVPSEVFKNVGFAKNLTVDVRFNLQLKNLLNPSSGSQPNLFSKIFLLDAKLSGSSWTCDCDLGWVEVWQRKKRQYLCGESLSVAASFTTPEYLCRHSEDDLRTTFCSNKNNESLLEVLKNDIECGWSLALQLQPLKLLLVLALTAIVLVKI